MYVFLLTISLEILDLHVKTSTVMYLGLDLVGLLMIYAID